LFHVYFSLIGIFPFLIYVGFYKKGFITIYDMFLLMCGAKSMSTKNNKKMDLLDLPAAERKRLCLEIRAALRERVAVGMIPLSDNVVTAKRNMWDSSDPKHLDEEEKDSDSLRRRKLMNVLAKRIW
jgi:hypothetical protein